MIDNGYSIDVLTQPPITKEKLSGYGILVVAQPDIDREGEPAYFLSPEVQAIADFLNQGGGLWLMGDPVIAHDLPGGNFITEFMKGMIEYLLFRKLLLPDAQLYFMDFSTLYRYPEVLNGLLKGLGLEMRFNFDLILDTNLMTDPYFYQSMVSVVPPQILDRIWLAVENAFGGRERARMGMILISAEDNDATHPLWEGVDQFMVGWGCSVDGGEPIGRSSKTALTIDRKEMVGMGGDLATLMTNLVPLFLDPSSSKPSGSQPVVLAVEEYGPGRVLAWGDLNWVQKEAWVGVEVFHDPYYCYEQLTLNIADYLSTSPRP
jgi:hypothetical protein